jgi:ABC-2 type transport system permease protein
MVQKFYALLKKELNVFFSMPIAYAIIAVYAGISGWIFSAITNYYAMISLRSNNQYSRGMIDLSIVEGIFRQYFNNVVVVIILIIPLITMRLFAEEKREGTSELLFTYPISDTAVVMAKFASAFSVYLLMIAGGLSSFIILRFGTDFELLPVLTGFFGLFLMGAAFIMLGIFVSSMTESQIVAAAVSFGTLLLFLLIPWAAESAGHFWGTILNALAAVRHFDSFAKGVLDTADITYFISFFFIFLFLTLQILESKRWRG